MTGPEGAAGSVPTVGALLERRALLDRDTPALIAGSLRLSFGQLQTWAEAVAEAFAAAGVGKGDRVAVLSHNSAEGVALYYGAARGGTILCNLNIRLTEDELARILATPNRRCWSPIPTSPTSPATSQRDSGSDGSGASTQRRCRRLRNGEAERVPRPPPGPPPELSAGSRRSPPPIRCCWSIPRARLAGRKAP